MLSRIKYFVVTVLMLSISLFGFMGARTYAQAVVDPTGQACKALSVASGDKECGAKAGVNVNNTLKLAINVLSLIVGIAAVIMIIVGGLKYVLSQGEGANTASAKNTIIYALVGLVVVALAQVIVKFVLDKSKSTAKTCKPPTTLQADGTCK